jgi:predicted dehydrogenase
MSGKIYNVAVVGCGIGRSHIVEGYVPNADKFKVAAICDLNRERLKTIGDEFGIERRVVEFDELLADPTIDIIDICTPPMVHYSQVMAALKAGKHVICEKPLVGSLARCRRGHGRGKDRQGRADADLPVSLRRRHPEGKAIIDAGHRRQALHGSVETLWLRTPDYYAVPWRGKWATELGGVLMTHALHLHDMLTYLMGPASGLFGRVATRVNDIEVEDCAGASC